jgi:hypothetical protein
MSETILNSFFILFFFGLSKFSTMVISTCHHNYDSTINTNKQHDMLGDQSAINTNHDYSSNLNTDKQHDMSGDQSAMHTNESQPHVSSCTSTSNGQLIISSKNTTQVINSASSSNVAKKRNSSENAIQLDTSNDVEKRNSSGNTSSLLHQVDDMNAVSDKATGVSVLKRTCSRVTNLAVNRYSLDSFSSKLNSEIFSSSKQDSSSSENDEDQPEVKSNVRSSHMSSSSKQSDIDDCSDSASSSSDNSNDDEEANVSQESAKTSSKNDEDPLSSSSKQSDIDDRSGSTSSSSDHSNVDEGAKVSQEGVETSNIPLQVTLKPSTGVDNFTIMTSGNDKTRATNDSISTTEQVINPSVFTLSLFLHATEECLVNQPISNYHRLVINNLKKKSFLSALATQTTDITKEIYVTMYEIKKNENPAFTTPKL